MTLGEPKPGQLVHALRNSHDRSPENRPTPHRLSCGWFFMLRGLCGLIAAGCALAMVADARRADHHPLGQLLRTDAAITVQFAED